MIPPTIPYPRANEGKKLLAHSVRTQMQCVNRLAEGSAPVRLSNSVAVDNVERTRDIYRSFMK